MKPVRGMAGRRVLLLSTLAVIGACTGPAAVEPVRRQVASEPSKQPIPEQTGYCTRLQPLLNRAVQSAQIGSEVTCLDLPGTTELGRYGPSSAAEEDALENCFSEPDKYQSLVERPEARFQLAIDDAFMVDTERSGTLALSALVPWLPEVSVADGKTSQLSARVLIRDAHFVTLVGVATKLQGEAREEQCLRALCNSDYSYVHKALVGTPSVVLNSIGGMRQGLGLQTGPLGVHFQKQQLSSGALQVTSTKPVTLAVARSSFRTPQTQRLCQFCGKQDQVCCQDPTQCDGGLGCIDERCVPVGGPGQPCNNGSCTEGATCVAGTCRVECGGFGQPCCARRGCSGEFHCAPNPRNASETLVLSQRVLVEGGLFGTSEDRVLGLSNCAGLQQRSRHALTKLGTGRGECVKAWWFDPQNARDCRVGVHLQVSTFGSIECQLDVYATPPPEPDICTR